MTVHAAKGLEFPVVFLVNLARGTGGVRQPIRVVLDGPDGNPSVSIASFESAADEQESVREREETKRLLYVAVTRARDRLYLSTVLDGGRLRPGRGSLAEVLPSSLARVFTDAARGGTEEAFVEWKVSEERTYRFRVCRSARARKTIQTSNPEEWIDDLSPVRAATSMPRASVSSIVHAETGAGLEPPRVREAADLAGTLVHRLLQAAASRQVSEDEARRLATRPSCRS
jgi:ATP-dependent exoDNAse (exonuclease V) beta subunit